MKKFFKIFTGLVLVAVVIVGVVSAPMIKRGYKMYSAALADTPIEDKVAEICSSEKYTPYEEISPVFIDTLVESEDRRFFRHGGFDVISFTRAVFANISAGSFSQGGSTLTQQLAKNMYFSFEKRIERKVAELLVAFQLEKMYTKEEILAMYCAMAYFGENCYGIKQASGYYYGIAPAQLDGIQSAELVETLKAPSIRNPSTMKR